MANKNSTPPPASPNMVPTNAARRRFFKIAGAGSLIAAGFGKSNDAFAMKLPAPNANTKNFTGGKFPKARTMAKGRVLGANDRILMAYVGLGGMGTSHVQDFLKNEKAWNTQTAGLCDPYSRRVDRARNMVVEGSKGCAAVQADKDYRKILENKDIDAVLLATPEHWHSQIAVHAMEAGKHVYVEKPMSRYIDEAFQIYDAKKKTGKIVQVGAQGTSEKKYHKSAELIKEGKVGQLVSVQTSYCRNSATGEWNYSIDPEAGPDNLDWEMWLGSAPKRPWNEDSKERFFRYRKYFDYSGGILGDLMPHMIYPSLLAAGTNEYPSRVSAIGTRKISTDREVADSVSVMAEFPSGWTFLFVGSTVNEQGLREMIRGNKGSIYLAGKDPELAPERPYAEEIDPGKFTLEEPQPRHSVHRENFLTAIRTNTEPNCNIELGIRGQVLVSMAEIAQRTGKTIVFDEKKRTFKPA